MDNDDKPINDTTAPSDDSRNEAEEWKNKYLRALADYQNLERRVARDREEEIKFAGKQFITKLLPALDVIEKAREHIDDKGLHLAVKQLADVIANEHVERMIVLGKPFDPHTMECIEVIPGGTSDTVAEEVRPGYVLHGQVIRPAQVKVGKTSDKSSNDKDQSSNKIQNPKSKKE